MKFTAALLFATAIHANAAEAPLVGDEPILVPDSKGGFDFLEMDNTNHRLLADHTGNGTLDVFDADSGKLLKHIKTGAAQGVSVDEKAGKYFVSVSKEKLLAIIDSKTLEKTGEVKTSGPGDALALDTKRGNVYVGHDDEKELWVIDTKAQKLATTIAIPAGPEYVLYDATTDRIFQNIKTTAEVVVIDPATHTIKANWSTAPALKPHGLALDEKTQRLFAAGANGKLVMMDAKDGKVLATLDIASGVDQIAFDAGNQRVYCASGSGVISVVQETATGATSLGNVKTNPGAKTVTVDAKTHAVWIAYADKDASYVRRFQAK